MWYTTQELAKKLGVSNRTVQRRAKKGEWEHKYEDNPNGQPKLLVFYQDQSSDDKSVTTDRDFSGDTVVTTPSDDKPVTTSSDDSDDTPIEPEIPGDDTLTAKSANSSVPARNTERGVTAKAPAPPALCDRGITAPPPTSVALPVVDGEVIQDDAHEFRQEYEDRAKLRALLCERALTILDDAESKKDGWAFVEATYNNGKLFPELLKLEGTKTHWAIRKWLKAYLESGKKYTALLPHYRTGSGSEITEFEEDFLLDLLVGKNAGNQILIGSAITALKQEVTIAALKGHSTVLVQGKEYPAESPSSEATLRRWVNGWKRKNKGLWTLHRHGEKALRDAFLKSVLRDESQIKPGDIWFSDGHKLNFMSINPDSGKEQRLNFIPFFDYASRMVVGASVDWTENTQAIADAFRNSVLWTGYLPKIIYIDNGRAYRSKFFNEVSQDRFEAEMNGVFGRLGIQVVFAKPYNAKAKIIERFFRTFDMQFERRMSSYIGASIDRKPARMRRNEKHAQNRASELIPTVRDTILAIEGWCINYYGRWEHRGIGAKPLEVLMSAEIDPSRRISEEQLNHCMLSSSTRKLSKEGLKLHGILYQADHSCPK